ncbi:DUF5050 domain-containing protein [Clostridium omnivorum]|uniref:DUF5050 domain-containing protein n=1 Tax=Clostridium omnivorum TaxID=1604902 RepID=A0ABQ5N622_9CLOT|nr:DUF5050 domain-containing protein [Clostridium sp. E14]GLC30683.1 hypothetical protein bsdE14_20930 [Clostridium sp. E14]
MFYCKKCKSSIEDSHRYCHGCGAYIGEPAVRADDWQQLENNGDEEIQYEYSEEGKIITLHCEKCDAVVEKYHKYCTNCGRNLENNIRTELIDPKTLDESSIDSEEEVGAIGKYEKKISALINKFFSNKKLVAVTSIFLMSLIVGIYIGKVYFKPVPRYEQDASYKTFAQDKDGMYYSYFIDSQVNELHEKRGVYKAKSDGTNAVKISDKPAAYLNLYKNYIYYINFDDRKIYRMKKDGSDNKKISDEMAISLLVDRGYIYYRDKVAEEAGSTLFRMKLDGSKKVEVTKDALSYNIIDNYIYYSSRASLGEVYRIKTDGSNKTKICKINGVLKYIKDDYIYYSMAQENITDAAQFMYNTTYLNKVKLDGTNSTKLTNEPVYSFYVDKNNIVYFEQFDNQNRDITINLYKVNSDGQGKTKIAEKISSFFYIADDQVFYIDNENQLPYRKDFKGSNSISLLGIDEAAAEKYKIEAIKKQTLPADSVETVNKNIDSMFVVYLGQKGNSKVSEAYNTRVLDMFVQNSGGGKQYVRVTKFINDSATTNLNEVIDMQSDGSRIMYISYKKDGSNYKVENVKFYEGIIEKQDNYSIKYFLVEKKNDTEEKGLEILSINKDNIRS